MAKKERIKIDDFRRFLQALRLMSEYGEDVLTRAEGEDVFSTNFQSGVRGIEYVYRTVEGLVGSVKAAPAWELLEPIVETHNPPKESGSAKQIATEGKKAVRQIRKGRAKQ